MATLKKRCGFTVLIFLQGFIATLKDSYGFIESEEHDCELFFPFRYVV